MHFRHPVQLPSQDLQLHGLFEGERLVGGACWLSGSDLVVDSFDPGNFDLPERWS